MFLELLYFVIIVVYLLYLIRLGLALGWDAMEV